MKIELVGMEMGTRGTRPSGSGTTPIGVGSLFLHTAGCTCGYSCCCPPDSGILKTRHNELLVIGILDGLKKYFGVSSRRLLRGLKRAGESVVWEEMGTRGTRPSGSGTTPIGVGSLFLHTAGCTCGYSCCCPSDSGTLEGRRREVLTIGCLFGVSSRRLLRSVTFSLSRFQLFAFHSVLHSDL